ncbi:MAG: hypothetical protein C4288_00055 [Leptolyngbya sp. ERB_1_1]
MPEFCLNFAINWTQNVSTIEFKLRNLNEIDRLRSIFCNGAVGIVRSPLWEHEDCQRFTKI